MCKFHPIVENFILRIQFEMIYCYHNCKFLFFLFVDFIIAAPISIVSRITYAFLTALLHSPFLITHSNFLLTKKVEF